MLVYMENWFSSPMTTTSRMYKGGRVKNINESDNDMQKDLELKAKWVKQGRDTAERKYCGEILRSLCHTFFLVFSSHLGGLTGN